jgi:hypothetical protein
MRRLFGADSLHWNNAARRGPFLPAATPDAANWCAIGVVYDASARQYALGVTR